MSTPSTSKTASTLPMDGARQLCAAAGVGAPVDLVRVPGGKNNRVFRVDGADGPFVLKCYFRHPEDPRDRLGAEWKFLSHAWARGVRCVPEPLACDTTLGMALYSFVEGEKLSADAVSRSHVEEAARFVCALNEGARDLSRLDPGSEACFSVSDHLERIDARVQRLARLDEAAPFATEAEIFLADGLRPTWDRIKRRTLDVCETAGIAPDAGIPESEVIASPSDFGFHNALWAEGRGLVFLDFEYAGRDDPAKLAGDFFNCPEIPTPAEHFDLFVETLVYGLSLGKRAGTRMRSMRNAYRIKWACILLNDFLPHGDARRRFAEQGERSERCAMQLRKAQKMIEAAAAA
ncbi:MAG: aminoglycoside phosphotransferase family protein [Alphaproteobacteria bacterium]|nr:aminoglycoside phosphotransferase family protein [Alphaproteobacteria bacterium]